MSSALNARWDAEKMTFRLWAKDASIWTGRDESQWMGFLDAVATARIQLPGWELFAKTICKEGYTHAVLLGMGGSALFPYVCSQIFQSQPGFLKLYVLDSVIPEDVHRMWQQVQNDKTLFLVSSKSGNTLEVQLLERYFFEQYARKERLPGKHFVAITDPNTPLHALALEKQYRHVFFGEPSIGGRFSAISSFGMVPSLLMGVDWNQLLQHAEKMVLQCGFGLLAEDNAGVGLGLQLGEAFLKGKNKLTFLLPEPLLVFGLWLEQLFAESLGKQGKGFLPIVNEPILETYGSDRIFVAIRFMPDRDESLEKHVKAIQDQGHSLVCLELEDIQHIAGQVFLFEMATVVAGAVMGVHPFDQPDVESSKQRAKQWMGIHRPKVEPLLEQEDIAIFVSPHLDGSIHTVPACLEGFLKKHSMQDGIHLLAFLPTEPEIIKCLNSIRHLLSKRFLLPTTLGFGPRYLHSTGQFHKGGFDPGLFVMLTMETNKQIWEGEINNTFLWQALGDFAVLSERKRRILRMHLMHPFNHLEQIEQWLRNIP